MTKNFKQTQLKYPIARLINQNSMINLSGNYDYLSDGYYLSQDIELSGAMVRPTCEEMLDAYILPLMLEKAKKLGIPIPDYYISNGYFEPPAVIDPINPFTLKGRVVLKPGHAKTISKSLTRNFTYAICCQEIPQGSEIRYFRSILGWTSAKSHHNIARTVWEQFGIPLAKVRVIITPENKTLLSDISPLFTEDLKKGEWDHLKEMVVWDN